MVCRIDYIKFITFSHWIGAEHVANLPVANQGKTKFVEEYLATHGDTRRPAIIEAWRAAGHEDEISESLVSKLRAKHGLTTTRGTTSDSYQTDDSPEDDSDEDSLTSGRRRGRPRQEIHDSMTLDDSLGGSKPGKSAFVAHLLAENPETNIRDVNHAWGEAGHDDTISSPTYYKVKARLAASGSADVALSSRAGVAGASRTEAPSRPSRTATTPSVSPGHPHGKRQVVDEVEAGIDDLMFRLKTSGGMPEVEAALRAARRQLYADGEN